MCSDAPTMQTSSASRYTDLRSDFPQEAAPWLSSFFELQTVVTQLLPIRGTGGLRGDLQRVVSRIARRLTELAHGVDPDRADYLRERALLACREARTVLFALKTCSALSDVEHRRARDALSFLAQMLMAELAPPSPAPSNRSDEDGERDETEVHECDPLAATARAEVIGDADSQIVEPSSDEILGKPPGDPH